MRCELCGWQSMGPHDWLHECNAVPTMRPPHERKDSLDNSEPPEEGTYHTFVNRMEYRADRRETREWRIGNEQRLSRIEKRLTVVGLVIAAISAASNGAVPWEKVAQALGW